MPATTRTATIPMTMIVRNPTLSDRSVENDSVTPDAPNTRRNNTIWTMNPDTESIAPADIAAAAGMPKRCRKRTLTATRAADAGIARLM